jgi:hypothetical protein
MGVIFTIINMMKNQIFEHNNIEPEQDNLLSTSMLDPDKNEKIQQKLDYSREEYLKVVDNDSLSLEHINRYSNNLIRDIENISGVSKSNIKMDDNTLVLINNKKYILKEGDSLIIGRSNLLLDHSNGIYIPEYFKPYRISRIHVILLMISDIIFVIDTGSYNGVRTISRSDKTKELEHSTKENRNILKFHISERADMIIGKYELIIIGGGVKRYNFCRKRKHSEI